MQQQPSDQTTGQAAPRTEGANQPSGNQNMPPAQSNQNNAPAQNNQNNAPAQTNQNNAPAPSTMGQPAQKR